MKKLPVLISILGLLALSLPVIAGPGSFEQAVGLYKSGKYAQALESFKQFGAAYPNNGLVHYYTAMSHQAVGHIDQAKQEYQLAANYGDASLKQLAAAGLAQLSHVRTQGSYSGSSSATSASATQTASAPKAGAKVRRILEFYSDT